MRKGTFTLAADGTLTGSVDTLHSGPEGADFRMLPQVHRRERAPRILGEIRLARDLPGVTLDSFQFVQPAALDKPLEFHYKVTVPQYAHQAGPLLLVRPRVVGDDVASHSTTSRAPCPLTLDATGHWHDSFDITLPPGYVVDETPDPVDVDLDFASYHSSVTAKGNVLHYEREYVVRQVEIPASRRQPISASWKSAILRRREGRGGAEEAVAGGSANQRQTRSFAPVRSHRLRFRRIHSSGSLNPHAEHIILYDSSSFFSFRASFRLISQPHRRLAHVPVLLRRRVRQRLASGSPGQPRAGRRGAGDRRRPRRFCPRAASRRPTSASGRTSTLRTLRADRALPSLAGRARRHSAGPRGPQGEHVARLSQATGAGAPAEGGGSRLRQARWLLRRDYRRARGAGPGRHRRGD